MNDTRRPEMIQAGAELKRAQDVATDGVLDAAFVELEQIVEELSFNQREGLESAIRRLADRLQPICAPDARHGEACSDPSPGPGNETAAVPNYSPLTCRVIRIRERIAAILRHQRAMAVGVDDLSAQLDVNG